MRTEREILDIILSLRQQTRCTKFVGAITMEVLRNEFLNFNFNISNRDVFISGIPNEIDFLIAKKDSIPVENIVYNPDDVLAVFEIKFRGSYGKEAVSRIKRIFDSIKDLNEKIECYYISVSENSKYKYRITKEKSIKNERWQKWF